jgi:toxin ParE1/3/4
LAAIYAYESNPKAAQAVKYRIQETIQRLADHPYMGRPSDRLANLRVKPIVRYPYLVFYSLSGDEVRIVHIRHAARRPWEGNDEGSQE